MESIIVPSKSNSRPSKVSTSGGAEKFASAVDMVGEDKVVDEKQCNLVDEMDAGLNVSVTLIISPNTEQRIINEKKENVSYRLSKLPRTVG